MTIPWTPLLNVYVVALGGAVAVVGLLALATVGLRLPARTLRRSSTASPIRRGMPSSRAGTAMAMACLVAAGAVVLFGLREILANQGS